MIARQQHALKTLQPNGILRWSKSFAKPSKNCGRQKDIKTRGRGDERSQLADLLFEMLNLPMVTALRTTETKHARFSQSYLSSSKIMNTLLQAIHSYDNLQ